MDRDADVAQYREVANSEHSTGFFLVEMGRLRTTKQGSKCLGKASTTVFSVHSWSLHVRQKSCTLAGHDSAPGFTRNTHDPGESLDRATASTGQPDPRLPNSRREPNRKPTRCGSAAILCCCAVAPSSTLSPSLSSLRVVVLVVVFFFDLFLPHAVRKHCIERDSRIIIHVRTCPRGIHAFKLAVLAFDDGNDRCSTFQTLLCVRSRSCPTLFCLSGHRQ